MGVCVADLAGRRDPSPPLGGPPMIGRLMGAVYATVRSAVDEQFQNELHAMQEVGRDRARARGMAFGLAWAGIAALMFALRYGGVRIGFIYIGGISGALAGGIAMAVTKSLTPGYVTRAAKKYGISEEKLRPDKYLID